MFTARLAVARKAPVFMALGGISAVGSHTAFNHCQVPCGIYDDKAVFNKMLQDTSTIRKAVASIPDLSRRSSSDPLALNQASRWVSNKEAHATYIITTISEYCLTQKVKPVKRGEKGYDDYLASLAAHHRVLKAAMATKQTVSEEAVAELEAAIKDLWKFYDVHKH